MKMILFQVGKEPRVVNRPCTQHALETMIGGAPITVNADSNDRFALVRDGLAVEGGKRYNRKLLENGRRIESIYGDFVIVRWKAGGGICGVKPEDVEAVRQVIS